MKDNNQTSNLEALIAAGIRSFKIEGRYKDLGYVKNITGHYRRALDRIMEGRPAHLPPLRASSSGRLPSSSHPTRTRPSIVAPPTIS